MGLKTKDAKLLKFTRKFQTVIGYPTWIYQDLNLSDSPVDL